MGRQKTVKLVRGVRERKYPSGERRLEIQFQLKGKTCKQILYGYDPDDDDDREEANDLLRKIKREIRKNEDEFDYAEHFPNSPKAQKRENRGKNILVQDIAKELLADELRSKPDNGTKGYAKKTFDEWIDTDIGQLPITLFRQHHIRGWVRVQPTQYKTISNKLTGLRKVVETAISDELIENNPFKNLDVKKLLSAEQIEAEEEKDPPDPFTLSEIEAILKATDERYGPLMKNFIQFAFHTGLRPSEMFALGWDKVTLSETQNTVLVEGVIIKGKHKQKRNKTKASRRTVILTPKAIESLNEQQLLTADEDYVWMRPGGHGRFASSDNLRERWILILKDAGVRYRSPYQMRHTYASQLLSGGENIWFVAEQMGHKGIKMCLQHYGAWISEGKAEHQHQFVSPFAKEENNNNSEGDDK